MLNLSGTSALAAVFCISGCVTQEIKVTYEPDAFGVPVPIVNGERYPMTEEERRTIGQKFVNAYCPVD